MTAVNLRAGKSDKRRNSRSNGDVILIPAHLCGSSTRECICISGTLPPLYKEFGGAQKRPVSNGPDKAPSTVPLNPPPVTSAVGHRKQPGLIVQTAITAARIAAGSAVGHTTGAA